MSTDYVIRKIDHKPLTAQLDAAAKRINRRERQVPAWQPKRAPYQAKGFRSSSLHGCQRLVAYRLAGTPQTDDVFNADWNKSAEQGNVLHTLLQDEANEAGLIWQHPTFGPALELPLALATAPELEAQRSAIPLTGTVDMVMKQKDGTLAIGDVKTVAAKYMTSGYAKYFAAKLAGYATQVSSYCHFFATPDGERARNAFVLVVSRDNTADRLLYHIPYAEEAFSYDLSRVEAASAAVKAKRLPAPEISDECSKFCPWQQRCIKDRTWAAMTEDMADEVSA